MSWLFGRGRKLSDLVTCIVSLEPGSWSVTWASDGRTPGNFSARSLTEAADRASKDVGQLYADHLEKATRSELQFAIYPWSGNAGAVILDVSRDGSEFVAKDIQGSAAEFRGGTLDDLADKASKGLTDPSAAMIRWIRPVSELF